MLFDDTKAHPNYLILQITYSTTQQTSISPDNSGVYLYLSNILRPSNADWLMISAVSNDTRDDRTSSPLELCRICNITSSITISLVPSSMSRSGEEVQITVTSGSTRSALALFDPADYHNINSSSTPINNNIVLASGKLELCCTHTYSCWATLLVWPDSGIPECN